MPGSGTQVPSKLGPYELVRHIATGGMAEVYLARRDGPHGFTKTVALKRILPQLASDPDFVAMFVDEARVCAQLSHPNLVQVFDFGESGTELYMAMEYVDGTTCAKLVRRAASLRETLPIDAALHVILSVLRGLEYAHDAVDVDGIPLGLIHRDVSPGNILIARSGAVKLGDFGIARADEFERRTEEGQLKGKLGYMSPEQVTGRPIDSRSDLFTLGIVFSEILTSRPLFGSGNELDVLMRIRDADLSTFERGSSHLPSELRAIVRQSLAQLPENRFQSAGAFAEVIEDFIRQQRLSVGASRLVAWLERAGLVTSNRSGEHALDLKAQRSRPTPGVGTPKLTPPTGNLKSPLDIQTPRPRISEASASSHGGAISPAVYRITQGDTILGPIAYARLVELFATGKASADTLVAREGGPFRPARDLPELARLLVSPALSMPPDAPSHQRETWRIDRASHPSRLFALALRHETGLLVATQNDRRKQVFFADGGLAFTTSTDKAELLGEQLIARGLVLPMEVDMALALCPRYGGRLGDALVGLGVLRPVELFRALVAQTHERFIELLAWKQGQIDFIRGVRVDGETLLHGASALELITDGIEKGYPDDEIERIMSPLLSTEVRTAQPREVSVKLLRLPPRQAAVLSAIDHPFVVSCIIEDFGSKGEAGRGEVLRALFIGLSVQLLIAPGWPVSTLRTQPRDKP